MIIKSSLNGHSHKKDQKVFALFPKRKKKHTQKNQKQKKKFLKKLPKKHNAHNYLIFFF